MRKVITLLFLALFSFVINQTSFAQLTGTKNIPGDYATLTLAIADLNAQGVGAGGVTFNVAAGYTQTLTARLNITATGTSANQIIFRKDPATSGANPLLTAYVGTSTPGSAVPDGMWSLQGSDFVTIDGIDLLDPNATNPATMEYGYGLFKNGATDGAQNNIIKNCVVTLNRVNNASGTSPMVDGSVGILVINSLPTTATTGITPTSSTGANSNNKFYTNTVQNCNIGIALSGYAAATPFTLGDTGNDIGGTSTSTGNTILNYGGGAATNPAAGIRANNEWSVNISYNTINNNNGAGVNHATTLRGIYGQAGTSANATINNNTITLQCVATTSACTAIENAIGSTAASNTVNINNNIIQNCTYSTATTGTFTAILSSSTATTVNMNGNTVNNNTVGASTTTSVGVFQGIYSSSAATNLSISNNTVTNNQILNQGGLMYCTRASTSLITYSGNTINANSIPNTAGTLASSLYGYYNLVSATLENFTNNNINTLTISGATTSTSNIIYGMYTFTVSTDAITFSANTIHTLAFNNSSTGAVTINGLRNSSGGTIIYSKNKIYNLSGNGTSSAVFGIYVGSGTSVTVSNNLIGDLRTPTVNAAINLAGINVAGSTATSLYYNTVYLNASSTGALFGSAALYSSSTPTLDARDNIFVNLSTPAGATGFAVAYRRSTTTLTTYASASNNNLFYAGTPSATNLIFYDGTNSDQTLAAFMTRVSPRDAASITENPPFLSTTGSSSSFLHINTTIATQIESGGITVSGIITDYDGDTRNASLPDIGADEFAGIGIDNSAPAISYTILGNTGSTSNRSFTNVSISDASGVNTNPGTMPRVYYKKTSNANTFNDNSPGSDGWKYSEANVTSSPFDFTIDYTRLFGGGGVSSGDTIQYFVVAQDLAGTVHVGINSGTFSATPADVGLAGAFPILGIINKYAINAPPLSGTYTIGLSMFNKLSGLDLQVKTMTRKVRVPVEEPLNDRTGLSTEEKNPNGNVSTSSAFSNSGNATTKAHYEEVEEEYSELYTKDGRKYTGNLFAEYPNGGKGDMLMGNYATITAALSDLNGLGVSGAVTFLLIDANYPSETYPLQFNSSISGISSVNTVTLKPQTGVTATIPGTIASNAAMRILSSYITIDGSNSGGADRSLTIQNTSATTPSVVLVGSTGTTSISNITVKNCVIANGVNTSSALVVSDATTIGNAGYFNTVTLQNNSITKASSGIYVNATTGNNLFVYNNVLNASGSDAIGVTGIYVQGVNGGTISGNNVGNIINSAAATNQRNGIWLATGSLNITVEKNIVHDLSYTGTAGYGAHGIKISNGGTASTGIVVKNNMIYAINGDADSYTTFGATYSPVGIYAFGSAQILSIYNNSIYLSGNTLNFTALSYSIGIGLDDGSIADVRNNLIVNNEGLLGATGTGAICLACETSNTQLSACNNNDYYANPSTGVKGLVKMGTGGTNQTTMSGVRTATGKDGASFNIVPVFASATDLHMTASDLSVSGRGAYIATVNADYDGDARQTSQSTVNRPVDVGADQYTPSGYTGNATVLNGSIYQDGGANGVEIVSGGFSTSGVTSFPGVRTPNNLNGKIVVQRNQETGKDSKGNIKEVKSLQTNTKGVNNGQGNNPLSVNVPWIYYSISGFNITTSPVTLRFYYNDEQLATISETSLEIAMWTGSTWEIVPGQTVNSASNYIQLSFDDWLGSGNWPSPMTFALTDLTSPLPVDLCSFNASAAGRNISLVWKTCSEINNKGFNVERRVLIDPATNRYSDWTNVAFINGHGTSTEEHTYSYSDIKLSTGKYQYRLRQQDFNGHEEYFTLNSPNVAEIGKPVKADVSQNYPNPSNPKSRIDYQIPFNGKVSIRVYDIVGREITTIINEVKEAGFYTAEFDGSSLASGVYFYRIIAEGDGQKFTDTKKMILVK